MNAPKTNDPNKSGPNQPSKPMGQKEQGGRPGTEPGSVGQDPMEFPRKPNEPERTHPKSRPGEAPEHRNQPGETDLPDIDE